MIDPVAFWLLPDWTGGSNLRDPGTAPFWLRSPVRTGEVPIYKVKTEMWTSPYLNSYVADGSLYVNAQLHNYRNSFDTIPEM